LIVVLGAYAAWNGYQYWQRNQAAQAASMFDEVEKVSREGDADKIERAFNEMKSRFASTAYAPQAGLLVAKTLYEAGKVDGAKAALNWVAEKSTDAGYAAVGRLRLAGLLMDGKAYDDALKVLDTGMPEEFAALQADRRGDILMAQGKKPEAKEQYLKAFKAFDERTDYRRLVLVKLNTLGVDPLADAAPKAVAAEKDTASK
jgi:predicted negative regulator of RcsB-dependent stress response